MRELEEDRAARDIKRQIDQLRAVKDFCAVAETEEGRGLIRGILADCSVYASTFTNDPLTTAYREGKRSVGLWILEQFAACPDLYIKFLTEKPND